MARFFSSTEDPCPNCGTEYLDFVEEDDDFDDDGGDFYEYYECGYCSCRFDLNLDSIW